MKLENFEAVATLIKRRGYLMTLKSSAEGANRIILGKHDCYPELCEKLRPEIVMIINQQIAVVEEQMSKLGVSVAQEHSDEVAASYISAPGGAGKAGVQKSWAADEQLPG